MRSTGVRTPSAVRFRRQLSHAVVLVLLAVPLAGQAETHEHVLERLNGPERQAALEEAARKQASLRALAEHEPSEPDIDLPPFPHVDYPPPGDFTRKVKGLKADEPLPAANTASDPELASADASALLPARTADEPEPIPLPEGRGETATGAGEKSGRTLSLRHLRAALGCAYVPPVEGSRPRHMDQDFDQDALIAAE